MDLPQPSRRQWIALAIILVMGLGLRSCHLANHLDAPLAKVDEVFTESDMAAFTIWAKKMAAGDWLCRDNHHAYPSWMEPIATLEQFEEWWGGKEVYHQNPLYAYMLAVSFWLSDSNVPLLVLQALCSALALLLVFDLARRMADVQAGLIAAGIAAVFAPTIVFDTIQLRASLNSSITLLSIWLLLRLRETGTIRYAVAAGVCLASSFMLRPTGLLLLVAGPVVLLLEKGTRSTCKRWLPALALAAFAVVAPFVIRNLIVGAPMLRFSTRGPETVIQANGAHADPGYMTVLPNDLYRELMEKGHGSVLSALGAAIDSWPESGWWLWHQWQKVLCVFGDYEYSNNVNFYTYRESTGLLEFLPTFGWIVGLAFVGMVMLGFRGRDRRALWIPLIALGALLIGCLLGFSLGRYRLPLAVLLILPAGAAVSLIVNWIRRRQFLAALLAIVAAVLLSILSFTVMPLRALPQGPTGTAAQPAEGRRIHVAMERLRPQEFLQSANILHKAKRTPEAIRVLDDYRERFLALITDCSQQLQEQRQAILNDPSQKELEMGLLQALYGLLRTGERNMGQLAQYYGVMGAEAQAQNAKRISEQMMAQARSMEGR